MDEEQFIVILQRYKELYDTFDENYHNQLRRDNIWEEIGEELGAKGEECRKRWNKLRDCFRKSLKNRKTKSGQGAFTSKPWRLEKQMEFMRPFIADRHQISTFEETILPNHPEENSEQRDTPSSSCQKRSRPPVTTSATILKEYLDVKRKKLQSKSGDHLTKYFQSCEETVRRLPEQLQVDAKKKISDILYELEVKALHLQHDYSYNPRPPIPAPECIYSNTTRSETITTDEIVEGNDNPDDSDFIEIMYIDEK